MDQHVPRSLGSHRVARYAWRAQEQRRTLAWSKVVLRVANGLLLSAVMLALIGFTTFVWKSLAVVLKLEAIVATVVLNVVRFSWLNAPTISSSVEL